MHVVQSTAFDKCANLLRQERNREATTLVQQTKELHEAYRMLGIMAAEQSEQVRSCITCTRVLKQVETSP